MATAAPGRGLTERSALELARAIRTGEASARDVVESHIAVLERTRGRVNALAAERFDAARREASAVDARVAAADVDEALPPLLGVPCTIKESIAVAGMPNCAGLVCRREHRAATTAPAAQRLLDAGAILLGVTNTSELCMWIETDNRVYGRTRNAYDPERIAGGSSGGEGAAVGCGGSPLGLGSDIGGSIRLPAFFNGVFGHKPSPGLVPNSDQFPTTTGDSASLLAIGPLARRAEDLIAALRIVSGPDGRDQRAREVALGDPGSVDLREMAVLTSDDASLRPPTRDMRAARDRAAAALARAGARVQDVSLRSMRRALELYLAALGAGAGVKLSELVVAEGALAPTWRNALVRGGPHTLATWLTFASESLFERLPSRRTQRAIAAGRALAREVESTLGSGVLLHPPHARVAPRHGRTVGRPWAVTSAAVFNLLGLPVTQVPLGLNARGLPLGVQVAAARDRDHVAIAVALELERALGGWVAPSR